jgi:hypothetical protein
VQLQEKKNNQKQKKHKNMEKIFATLEQLGVNEEQLPVDIQKDIDELDNQTIEFQKQFDNLVEEGKSEDEITEQLGDVDSDLDDIEDGIVEDIEAWYETNFQGQQAQPNVQYNNGGTTQKPQEKKKSGGGMVIFGIFALVLTLGAVNVLKNR